MGRLVWEVFDAQEPFEPFLGVEPFEVGHVCPAGSEPEQERGDVNHRVITLPLLLARIQGGFCPDTLPLAIILGEGLDYKHTAPSCGLFHGVELHFDQRIFHGIMFGHDPTLYFFQIHRKVKV